MIRCERCGMVVRKIRIRAMELPLPLTILNFLAALVVQENWGERGIIDQVPRLRGLLFLNGG